MGDDPQGCLVCRDQRSGEEGAQAVRAGLVQVSGRGGGRFADVVEDRSAARGSGAMLRASSPALWWVLGGAMAVPS
jgi:hypothetical protein